MRKTIRILSVLTALALTALILVSCGAKSFSAYTLEDTKQYVTLGQLKGLEVSKSEVDAQIKETTDKILSSYSSLESTGKPAEKGQRATFSATCSVDGNVEESLAIAQTTALAGGSGTKITEINEGLVGMSAGETKEITAVIPEGYTSDNAFANKEAVFTVTVTDVQANTQPAELTDELVSQYFNGLYTTVEQYEAEGRRTTIENLAFTKAYSLVTFSDPGYPKDLAEQLYNEQMKEYKSYASQLGISLEYLAQVYGMDLSGLCSRVSQSAISTVRQQLVLTAICRSENLKGTDEDINQVLQDYMSSSNYADADAVYRAVGKDQILLSADWAAAYRFLGENAVVVDDTEAEPEQEPAAES